ncbi:MAG: 50S ribosomal protein L4 [Candidatus Micrarchaeota archaeon]|nr:50S ribosomal protein L4 [Candidatus Micrarchaeota archaeon]MCX8154671.1 50S ribosomal protein L4 [Candidatus Micrarchaeota archaeon]
MKINIYDLNANVIGEIQVDLEIRYIRHDIIRRVVLGEESKMYQPKGNYRWAGMDTSARFVGREGIYGSLKDQGQARLPRELLGGGRYGRVRVVPQSVKGRRAHPPKPEKIIEEKVNKKERTLGMIHSVFGARLFVVRDLESIKKTKDGIRVVTKFIGNIDVESKRITGVRHRRKQRAYRVPVKATVVVKEGGKGFSNIQGIRFREYKNLMVRDIAPGGSLNNRNLIISESAFRELMERIGVRVIS